MSNPETLPNVLAFFRDLAVIVAATLLAWHRTGDPTTIGVVFGLFGTLIGASSSSRGVRLGVQAALAPSPGQTIRPPSPDDLPPPRGPMGSTL